MKMILTQNMIKQFVKKRHFFSFGQKDFFSFQISEYKVLCKYFARNSKKLQGFFNTI